MTDEAKKAAATLAQSVVGINAVRDDDGGWWICHPGQNAIHRVGVNGPQSKPHTVGGGPRYRPRPLGGGAAGCARSQGGVGLSGYRDSAKPYGSGGSGASAAFLQPDPEPLFRRPSGIARLGDSLFVSDTGNGRIREIHLRSLAVSTLAGSGEHICVEDNGFTEGSMRMPAQIAADAGRGVLYVCCPDAHRVIKVDATTGEIGFLVGDGKPGSRDGAVCGSSARTTARLRAPTGLAYDPDRDLLYICDDGSHCIRAVHIAHGMVTTLAGRAKPGSEDGIGSAAGFYHPHSCVLGDCGRALYIVERGAAAASTERLRRLELGSPASGGERHGVSSGNVFTVRTVGPLDPVEAVLENVKAMDANTPASKSMLVRGAVPPVLFSSPLTLSVNNETNKLALVQLLTEDATLLVLPVANGGAGVSDGSGAGGDAPAPRLEPPPQAQAASSETPSPGRGSSSALNLMDMVVSCTWLQVWEKILYVRRRGDGESTSISDPVCMFMGRETLLHLRVAVDLDASTARFWKLAAGTKADTDWSLTADSALYRETMVDWNEQSEGFVPKQYFHIAKRDEMIDTLVPAQPLERGATAILLAGCGVRVVNGLYFKDHMQTNAPVYTHADNHGCQLEFSTAKSCWFVRNGEDGVPYRTERRLSSAVNVLDGVWIPNDETGMEPMPSLHMVDGSEQDRARLSLALPDCMPAPGAAAAAVAEDALEVENTSAAEETATAAQPTSPPERWAHTIEDVNAMSHCREDELLRAVDRYLNLATEKGVASECGIGEGGSHAQAGRWEPPAPVLNGATRAPPIATDGDVITKTSMVKRPHLVRLQPQIAPRSKKEHSFQVLSESRGIRFAVVAAGNSSKEHPEHLWEYTADGELLHNSELVQLVDGFAGPFRGEGHDDLLGPLEHGHATDSDNSDGGARGDVLRGGANQHSSGDLINVLIDRVHNRAVFLKNGEFVGEARDLPATGEVFASASLTNVNNSVRTIGAQEADARMYLATLEALESMHTIAGGVGGAELTSAGWSRIIAAESVRRRCVAELLWAYTQSNPECRPVEVRRERARLRAWFDATYGAVPDAKLEMVTALRQLHHESPPTANDARRTNLVDVLARADPEEAAAVPHSNSSDSFVFDIPGLLRMPTVTTLPGALLLAALRCAEPNGVQLVELTSVCVGQWPMCTHEADDDGLHALDHALACHRYDIAKLLLDAGATAAGGLPWALGCAIYDCGSPERLHRLANAIGNTIVARVKVASDAHQQALNETGGGRRSDQSASRRGNIRGSSHGNDAPALPFVPIEQRLAVIGEFMNAMLLGPRFKKQHISAKVIPWLAAIAPSPERDRCVKRMNEIEASLMEEAIAIAARTRAEIIGLGSELGLQLQRVKRVFQSMRDVYFAVDRLMHVEEAGDASYRRGASLAASRLGALKPTHAASPGSTTELMLEAAAVREDYIAAMKQMVLDAGCGEFVEGPLKRPSRIIGKLVVRLDPDFLPPSAAAALAVFPFATVKDVVRGMVVAATATEAIKVQHLLSSSEAVVGHKDRAQSGQGTTGGWQDELYMAAVSPRGRGAATQRHVCETQLAREKMMMCREKLHGHHHFTQMRGVIEVLQQLEGEQYGSLVAELAGSPDPSAAEADRRLAALQRRLDEREASGTAAFAWIQTAKALLREREARIARQAKRIRELEEREFERDALIGRSSSSPELGETFLADAGDLLRSPSDPVPHRGRAAGKRRRPPLSFRGEDQVLSAAQARIKQLEAEVIHLRSSGPHWPGRTGSVRPSDRKPRRKQSSPEVRASQVSPSARLTPVHLSEKLGAAHEVKLRKGNNRELPPLERQPSAARR